MLSIWRSPFLCQHFSFFSSPPLSLFSSSPDLFLFSLITMDLQPLGSRDLPPDWLLSLAFPVRFSKHRLAWWVNKILWCSDHMRCSSLPVWCTHGVVNITEHSRRLPKHGRPVDLGDGVRYGGFIFLLRVNHASTRESYCYVWCFFFLLLKDHTSCMQYLLVAQQTHTSITSFSLAKRRLASFSN